MKQHQGFESNNHTTCATQIKRWLEQDENRMQALKVAASLALNDWCLAAGFLRNMIWDKLHGLEVSTPLNDIDLIYFDLSNTSEETEKHYEIQLREMLARPWSVKNQARMHDRNHDLAYTSTLDAMSYWVEIETAIGCCLSPTGNIELIAPFGLSPLFNYTVTINQKRNKLADFNTRITEKKWLSQWPKLRVIY